MQVDRIWLDALVVGDRLRTVDGAKVDALAASMAAIGLQQPVSVWFDEDETMHLVAGLHRVRAAEKLGWEQINAVTVEMDEIDRVLWEIDENLCRAELTEAQEAEHLARRKELWEARTQRQSAQLEPIESKRADGRGHRSEGFASETSAVTGQSKATVNRKVSRAEKIAPDVLKEITGTRWDRGVVLDVLKKLSHAEQRQALFRVKAGASPDFDDAYDFIRGEPTARPAPKPVKHAPDPMNDYETKERQVAALMAAWNRAGREAREEFLARIDRPVFDDTEAGRSDRPFAGARR